MASSRVRNGSEVIGGLSGYCVLKDRVKEILFLECFLSATGFSFNKTLIGCTA